MRFLTAAFCLCLASVAFASNGLVVHTTEFGVGKFHRYDNKVHPYGEKHAWTPYILADDAATDKAMTVKNADGSYTVFFSTLDEMMTSVVAIAKTENQKVSVLNVHGHGLPGAMWFPKDATALRSFACISWVQAAAGDDKGNYNQYYTPLDTSDVMYFRQVSNNPRYKMGCTTGAADWREGVEKHPEFKAALADDAQLHFLSCIVGLGTVGEAFTKDVAAAVLPSGKGHVQTSMMYGLGDWSIPEGMSFWDYQNQEQVDRDAKSYVTKHSDREIAQKGSIRMASFSGSAWTTSILTERDFMSVVFESNIAAGVESQTLAPMSFADEELPMPTHLRVPGTNSYVPVELQ